MWNSILYFWKCAHSLSTIEVCSTKKYDVLVFGNITLIWKRLVTYSWEIYKTDVCLCHLRKFAKTLRIQDDFVPIFPLRYSHRYSVMNIMYTNIIILMIYMSQLILCVISVHFFFLYYFINSVQYKLLYFQTRTLFSFLL